MRHLTAPLAAFTLAWFVHCSGDDPSSLTDDRASPPGAPACANVTSPGCAPAGSPAPGAGVPATSTPGTPAPDASEAAGAPSAPGPDTTTPVGPPPTSGLSVSPTGSDSNPGTLASPWKTIGHAVSQLKAGDVLYVRGGTYVESVRIDASGTSSAAIRVLAYPGESPVIDGQGWLPTGEWVPLVHLAGDYVEMSGVEVKNSNTKNNMGVVLSGRHDRMDRMDVHHNHSSGVLVSGDYGVVENSLVWDNARVNAGGVCQPEGMGIQCIWGSGLSAARDPTDGITENVVLRHNAVYNNWGEGLSSFEASGTIIEDNVVFNNWSVNLYASDTWNTLTQRNLIYVTGDTPIVGARRLPANLSLMDERATAMRNPAIHPRSHDNVIVNNVILGQGVCLMCWSEDAAIADGAALRNVLFAHNTIVGGSLSIASYPHQNARIMNNVFQTTNASVGTSAGLTFSNNAWSTTPSEHARSSGDFIGDAHLAGTGAFSNTAYSTGYFKLTASSVGVVDRAAPLPSVTADFFGAARGAQPDMGAIELVP